MSQSCSRERGNPVGDKEAPRALPLPLCIQAQVLRRKRIGQFELEFRMGSQILEFHQAIRYLQGHVPTQQRPIPG